MGVLGKELACERDLVLVEAQIFIVEMIEFQQAQALLQCANFLFVTGVVDTIGDVIVNRAVVLGVIGEEIHAAKYFVLQGGIR